MTQQNTKIPVQQGAQRLRRELKSRHLAMIAIGGSIGTGLFVASGATVSQAGYRWSIALLCIDWPDGLFPDDQSW